MNVHVSRHAAAILDPSVRRGHSLRTAEARSSVEVGRTEPPAAPVAPRHEWYLPVKPAADAMLALLLLIPAAPLILLAALITWLTSPGPAFYRQTRLGRHGRHFRLCKIRTMVHNAEARTGAVWAQENDPRVTRFGRFLRATHVDEFPQLIHVLSGHMSLVGPRPERPEFVHHLQWQVPRYLDRLNVKPGVTGLAQLLLPADSNVDDVRRKVQCDLYYVRYLSPWLDAKIMLQTAWLLTCTVAAMIATPLRLPTRERVFQRIADIAE